MSGSFEAVSPVAEGALVGSALGTIVSGAVPPVVAGLPGTAAGLLCLVVFAGSLTSTFTAASAPSGLASGTAVFLATSTAGVGFGSSFLPPERNTAAPAPTATSAPTRPPISGSFDFALGAATGPPRRRTVATGASSSSFSTTATGRRRTFATGASSSSSTTAARVLRAGAVALAANAVWHDLQRMVLPRYASGTSARAPHSGH